MQVGRLQGKGRRGRGQTRRSHPNGNKGEKGALGVRGKAGTIHKAWQGNGEAGRTGRSG